MSGTRKMVSFIPTTFSAVGGTTVWCCVLCERIWTVNLMKQFTVDDPLACCGVIHRLSRLMVTSKLRFHPDTASLVTDGIGRNGRVQSFTTDLKSSFMTKRLLTLKPLNSKFPWHYINSTGLFTNGCQCSLTIWRRSLGQGNVFTCVSHSVHKGRGE